MAENNSTQGVAWYVKPTSDTIDFIKSIPVDIWADAKNIEVFDDYVKIKSGGLNMVIPMIDAVGGKKDWDEAIARGAGDVLQDLVATTLLTSAFVVSGVTNPGILATGAALLITWVTSATDTSFGAFLEQELIKMKDDKFNGIILDNKNTMPDTLTIRDYQHNQTLTIDKNDKYAQIMADTQMIQDHILMTLLGTKDIGSLNINGQTYNINSMPDFDLSDTDKVGAFCDKFRDFLGANAINFGEFIGNLADNLNGWLDDFGAWIDGLVGIQLYDPIALDLDGDGAISIIGANDGSVYFDHDCDGVAFRSS